MVDGDMVNDRFMVLLPQTPTELVKDDWMFSGRMGMIAGAPYNVSVLYNGFDFNGTTANESFELIIVNEQSSTAAFQSVIGTYAGITQSGVIADPGGNDLITQAYTANETFIPTTSEPYYLAIRATTVGTASLFMVFNVSINGATLSLDEFNQNTITHIYNTITDLLTLQSSSLPFSGAEVFNIFGQRVLAKVLSQSQEVIEMSSLSSGIYLVKLNIEGNTKTIKLIKQ